MTLQHIADDTSDLRDNMDVILPGNVYQGLWGETREPVAVFINQDISESTWLLTIQGPDGRYYTVKARREEIGPRVDFKGGYRAFIHKIKVRPKVGMNGPMVLNDPRPDVKLDRTSWLMSRFKATQDLINKMKAGGL